MDLITKLYYEKSKILENKINILEQKFGNLIKEQTRSEGDLGQKNFDEDAYEVIIEKRKDPITGKTYNQRILRNKKTGQYTVDMTSYPQEDPAEQSSPQDVARKISGEVISKADEYIFDNPVGDIYTGVIDTFASENDTANNLIKYGLPLVAGGALDVWRGKRRGANIQAGIKAAAKKTVPVNLGIGSPTDISAEYTTIAGEKPRRTLRNLGNILPTDTRQSSRVYREFTPLKDPLIGPQPPFQPGLVAPQKPTETVLYTAKETPGIKYIKQGDEMIPEPTSAPKSAKTSSRPVNLAKGLVKGAAGLGFGTLGYGIGSEISDTTMDVLGVENEIARDISREAVGGAGAAALATGAVSALSPSVPLTAATIGTAAGTGALAGVAAYGGYKAGEAISNIEVDRRTGKQVSDVLGSYLYKTPLVNMAMNLIAGNKLSADTADLYEKPKGVPGGDPTKIAQNVAGEKEEEEEKKRLARSGAQLKNSIAENFMRKRYNSKFN